MLTFGRTRQKACVNFGGRICNVRKTVGGGRTVIKIVREA